MIENVVIGCFYGSLLFFWRWGAESRNMYLSVPGSLEREVFKRRCRVLRYPAIAFWPLAIAVNVINFMGDGLFFRTLDVAFTAVALFGLRKSWQLFKKQRDDDDDDPWNRGKKLAKKAGRAVRQAATIRVPTPAGLGAGA